MNVFVLNSGRCGSSTFIKACQHINNYTSAHESLAGKVGDARLAYKDQHIEADNRLCWFLGRLDQRYADEAIYVHLYRNHNDTVNSFIKRSDFGIMKAYREGFLLGADELLTEKDIATDYLTTIETNIQLFLKDKKNTMGFSMENAKENFISFWHLIGAKGHLDNALAEWDIQYNASR